MAFGRENCPDSESASFLQFACVFSRRATRELAINHRPGQRLRAIDRNGKNGFASDTFPSDLRTAQACRTASFCTPDYSIAKDLRAPPEAADARPGPRARHRPQRPR